MDQARARAAPPEVAERWMREYGDGILRQCFLFLGDREQAEDAAQETFVRAWRGYGDFQGEASERTWLTAIAANVCRNILRSPWNRRRVDLAFLEDRPVTAEEPDDTVLRAVLSLPAKYRQVVVLYYYRECSTGEIADMLELPQGTVSVRLKRARERLKPVLKEWYYGGA